MRWTHLAVAALVLAISLPLVAAAPQKAAKARAIERGEYLATTMSCGDCHTPGTLYGAPDMSRRFSGSELGWRGPWGVTYPRNLTPDAETGIGSWTEQQIVNAMRTGMRPDGRVLQPPMPWQNLSRLSDADAFAIAAYLKSLPAVKHQVPGPISPDQAAARTGSIIDFPPPSDWDAPKAPPAGTSGSH